MTTFLRTIPFPSFQSSAFLYWRQRCSHIHPAGRGAWRCFHNTKSSHNASRSWTKLKPQNESLRKKQGIFGKYTTLSLTKAIPPMIFLLIFFNDEQYSPIPIKLEFMAGESMMPTIFPRGECYIRIKSWALNEKLQIGDVIVFKDVKGGYACKRIIGLEGDTVDIYGEYAHLYQNESDLGIREIPMKFSWKEDIGVNEEGRNQFKVPPKMVWVEGDNPLHSVDSRHYGPICESCIVGKVVYRLWPQQRNDSSSPSIVTSSRPHPLTEKQMYNGSYGIEKIPYSK